MELYSLLTLYRLKILAKSQWVAFYLITQGGPLGLNIFLRVQKLLILAIDTAQNDILHAKFTLCGWN